MLNQTGKACRVEGGKRAAEGARKKKQKREKEAKSAAAAAPEEGSESDKKPLGRPPGRKDAAKRVRRTEAEQQRDAAVTAGLGNALGGTRPPQKPGQLVLDGREPRGGEKRKQLFVAALFASFVCCSDDKQKFAFYQRSLFEKRNREGRRSSCSRRTKKARQQQQRQHLR